MWDLAAAARLDWGWIEFVGLWLLGPLVFVLVTLPVLRHWRRHRHR